MDEALKQAYLDFLAAVIRANGRTVSRNVSYYVAPDETATALWPVLEKLDLVEARGPHFWKITPAAEEMTYAEYEARIVAEVSK